MSRGKRFESARRLRFLCSFAGKTWSNARALNFPDLHRDSEGPLYALRDRFHHQPHAGLWNAHSSAGCGLLRRYRRVAENLCRLHRPAVHPRCGGIHLPYSGAIHALEATYTVLHRPSLLSQEVRCRKDPGRFLCQAQGRDGPGRFECGAGIGREGDDATEARLFVVASRYNPAAPADKLAALFHPKSWKAYSPTLVPPLEEISLK